MPHALRRRTVLAGAAGLLAAPAIARAAATLRIGYQKNGSLVILRDRRMLEQKGIAASYVEFSSGP